MQKPEELVEKITKEEQELDIKLSDLECFMMSADFIKVSPEQKTLLEQQHKAMTEYKLILIKRAHRINWEAGRDKAAAEIKEATETKKTCKTCKWNNPVEVKGELVDNCSARSRMIDLGANNCWEAEEPDTGPAEQKPDLAVPGQCSCWNCKHKIQTGPGQVYYGCNSKRKCHDHSEWEAK